MKRLFLSLLFIVVCISLCHAADKADNEIKVPEILISKMQTWNAENGLEWCKPGLLGAVATSLGANPDSLTGLLGSLGGLTGGGASRSASLKLPSITTLNENEFLDNVSAAARSRSSSNSSDISEVLSYARNDFLLSQQLFGSGHVKLANTLVEGLLAPQIYSALQAALMNASSEGQVQDRAGLGDLDIGAILKSLEKTILLLTSKTYSQFFRQLIGPGSGMLPTVKNTFAGGGTPKDGLISPMINLLDAYCITQEYALENDVLPEQPICSIVNVVSSALACREDSFDATKCTPENYEKKTYLPKDGDAQVCVVQKGDNKGTKIPLDGSQAIVLDFDDLRPLPNTILTEQVDKEGVATFFLFRSTSAVFAYASNNYLCGQPKPAEDLMPGWEISQVISYMPDGSPKQAQTKVPDYPIALVGQPRNPNQHNECQKVISIRGTASEFEWGVDLDTMFVPFIDEGIEAHRGFVQLANSIWPSVQAVFNEFVDDDYCSGRHEVYITGHSLGGGLSITLGMKIAHHYGDHLKIHGATFAAPNVMNEAGVEWYRKRVNNRAITFDMDPVGSSPCGTQSPSGIPYSHGFPRCDGVHHSPFGFDKYHTNPGRVQFDLLKEIGGTDFLNLTPKIGIIDIRVFIIGMILSVDVDLAIPPPIQIGVSHLCSYACKTSMYCTDDSAKGWMCNRDACPSILGGIKMKMCCKIKSLTPIDMDCTQPCK